MPKKITPISIELDQVHSDDDIAIVGISIVLKISSVKIMKFVGKELSVSDLNSIIKNRL